MSPVHHAASRQVYRCGESEFPKLSLILPRAPAVLACQLMNEWLARHSWRRITQQFRGVPILRTDSNLEGFYSIRINDRWRVVFRWSGGNAFDVQVVDYH
jgi:hypothetical protein